MNEHVETRFHSTTKILRRRRRVWNHALNRQGKQGTQNQWQSEALISIKRLRKIRKFSEPRLAPPAPRCGPRRMNGIHHKAEELAWGLTHRRDGSGRSRARNGHSAASLLLRRRRSDVRARRRRRSGGRAVRRTRPTVARPGSCAYCSLCV